MLNNQQAYERECAIVHDPSSRSKGHVLIEAGNWMGGWLVEGEIASFRKLE